MILSLLSYSIFMRMDISTRLIILLIGCLCVGSQSAQNGVTAPYVIKNLGLGYNLLKGNPEDGSTSHTGFDPGLMFTRHILKLTPGDLPNEVVYDHHPKCRIGNSIDIFYGGKTYQEYLLQDIQTFGAADNYIKPYAFMMSKGYQDIEDRIRYYHDFYRDTISSCSIGHARFSIPSPSAAVTYEFAGSACDLPVAYNETAYISFLDTWGTHIVTEEEIGIKNVTRYRQSVNEIAKLMYNHSEKVGTMKEMSYLGYGTVIELNMTKFRHHEFQNAHDGSRDKVFSYGDSNNPEVIGFQLTTIAEVFDHKFLGFNPCPRINLGDLKNNIIHALQRYAIVKGVSGTPNDPNIIIPVTWPKGTYGLMKPISGCPKSPFPWYQGWTIQDNNDETNANSWTAGIHLAGNVSGDPRLEYCIKTFPGSSSEYEHDWPSGSYCILQKGYCPTGFSSGQIRWTDEFVNNGNSHGGVLPDGTFTSYTVVMYCCRSDGSVKTSIILPIDKPFYLLQHTADGCQQVKNMVARSEFLKIDTEDYRNRDSCYGTHPYDTNCTISGHQLFYCYYQKLNATVLDPIFG